MHNRDTVILKVNHPNQNNPLFFLKPTPPLLKDLIIKKKSYPCFTEQDEILLDYIPESCLERLSLHLSACDCRIKFSSTSRHKHFYNYYILATNIFNKKDIKMFTSLLNQKQFEFREVLNILFFYNTVLSKLILNHNLNSIISSTSSEYSCTSKQRSTQNKNCFLLAVLSVKMLRAHHAAPWGLSAAAQTGSQCQSAQEPSYLHLLTVHRMSIMQETSNIYTSWRER